MVQTLENMNDVREAYRINKSDEYKNLKELEKNFLGSYMNLGKEYDSSICDPCGDCGPGDCAPCCSTSDD